VCSAPKECRVEVLPRSLLCSRSNCLLLRLDRRHRKRKLLHLLRLLHSLVKLLLLLVVLLELELVLVLVVLLKLLLLLLRDSQRRSFRRECNSRRASFPRSRSDELFNLRAGEWPERRVVALAVALGHYKPSPGTPKAQTETEKSREK